MISLNNCNHRIITVPKITVLICVLTHLGSLSNWQVTTQITIINNRLVDLPTDLAFWMLTAVNNKVLPVWANYHLFATLRGSNGDQKKANRLPVSIQATYKISKNKFRLLRLPKNYLMISWPRIFIITLKYAFNETLYPSSLSFQAA